MLDRLRHDDCNQPRIVAKFKDIRDWALPSDDDAAERWEDVSRIRRLAKKIQELLPPPATEGGCPELQDLGVGLTGVKWLVP